MRRLLAALALCAGLPLLPGPAAAQDVRPRDGVVRALGRACAGHAGQVLTREQLAEALVVEFRLAPTLTEMAVIAADVARTGTSPRVTNNYRGGVRLLQEGLAQPGSNEAKAVIVSPAPPRLEGGAPNWLFDSAYTLTCASRDAPSPAQFTPLQHVAIRGSVEALDDLGDERKTAAAAQVGYDRTRVTNLNGATTRTETLTIDAAAGLAIGNVDRFAMLYADYSRNRKETRTAAGQRNVDEVEALELGVLGTARFGALRTTGRFGLTFDEITGARYLRGNLRLTPIVGARGGLGFCNLNSFRTIAPGIRARCSLSGEFELREVLRHGTAQIGATDTLAALGGTAGIEIGPGINANGRVDDGLVASARYTYLAVVHGGLPDIDRFEASLSYRWWVGDLGFDIGLTYADGTERKSFADENRLGFRIGLLY